MCYNTYNSKNKKYIKKELFKMASKTFINEYAKAKVAVKELTAKVKEMENEMYSIMVEDGRQTIGKKTYTLDTAKYQVKMTESDSSETVDWKSVALSVLKVDEKTAKEYAFKNGFITTRKGSIKFDANIKE